jgi:hypothetical protein
LSLKDNFTQFGAPPPPEEESHHFNGLAASAGGCYWSAPNGPGRRAEPLMPDTIATLQMFRKKLLLLSSGRNNKPSKQQTARLSLHSAVYIFTAENTCNSCRAAETTALHFCAA